MEVTPAEPTARSVPGLLLPVIAGAILSVVVFTLLPESDENQFEDLALGKETTSIYSSIDGYPIHCKHPEDGAKCIEGVKARGADSLVLWLGNSQVHAVNQLKSGEENAPPVLFRKLQKHGIDLVVFSQPNANLQEHYVLFEYLQQHININLLILPLVFDDMRETGLRADIRKALDDHLLGIVRQSDVGVQITSESGNTAGNDDFAGLANTVQDKSERRLNDWLSNNIEIWRERPALRGKFLTSLYRLRNFVFGITPNTKRKVIKGRYDLNRRALEQLLKSARSRGIKVIAYIAPLRNDVEIPYDLTEYEAYKEDMSNLVLSAGHVIFNYEDLVPGEYWGKKEATSVGGGAELDFMHFQAAGHRLLADALYSDIVGEL